MKKFFKPRILSLSFVLIAMFGLSKAFASATLIDRVDILIEQQEIVTNDKIRYVSKFVLSDGATLDDITKIDVELQLSKAGNDTKETEVSLTTVYDEVIGAFDKVDDTYYAVMTITELSKSFPLWTLSATFEYNYIDGTTEKTNTIQYLIPMPNTYIHVEATSPTCGDCGNYEYYYNPENSTYYDAHGNATTLEALTIPKTNNQSYDDSSVVAPTRLTHGSVTYTCTVCGNEKTITIDKLGTARVYFTKGQYWDTVYAYIYAPASNIYN
jgi:hypothetical protein